MSIVQLLPHQWKPNVDVTTLYTSWHLLLSKHYFCFIERRILSPWFYLFCIGTVNELGLLTQTLWPTAPPWYNELYGFQQPPQSMKGHAADLERIDKYAYIAF